jgi:hypothetical protein
MPTNHPTPRPLRARRPWQPGVHARRPGVALRLSAAGLVVGFAAVATAVLPAPIAGANTDTVTTCADSGTGSLPQVVAQAAANDLIDFSLACPVITLAETLVIPTDLTIDGPGAGTLAVSGGNLVPVLSLAQGITASVSGLTIDDGATADGSPGPTGPSTGTGQGSTGGNGGNGG